MRFRYLSRLLLLFALPALASAQPYGPGPQPLSGTQLPGSTTNDSATTGNVGEYIASSVVACGSATTGLTSGTAANVASISLTPGDWDVWAQIGVGANSSTNFVRIVGSVSTTSATSNNTGTLGTISLLNGGVQGASPSVYSTGMFRVSVAATTTVYAVVIATFTVSTAGGCGQIAARRVR